MPASANGTKSISSNAASRSKSKSSSPAGGKMGPNSSQSGAGGPKGTGGASTGNGNRGGSTTQTRTGNGKMGPDSSQKGGSPKAAPARDDRQPAAPKSSNTQRSPSDSQLSDPHNARPGETSSPMLRQAKARANAATAESNRIFSNSMPGNSNPDMNYGYGTPGNPVPALNNRNPTLGNNDAAVQYGPGTEAVPPTDRETMGTIVGADNSFPMDPSLSGRIAELGARLLGQTVYKTPGERVSLPPSDGQVTDVFTSQPVRMDPGIIAAMNPPASSVPGTSIFDSRGDQALTNAVLGEKAPVYRSPTNATTVQAWSSQPTEYPAGQGENSIFARNPKAIDDRVPQERDPAELASTVKQWRGSQIVNNAAHRGIGQTQANSVVAGIDPTSGAPETPAAAPARGIFDSLGGYAKSGWDAFTGANKRINEVPGGGKTVQEWGRATQARKARRALGETTGRGSPRADFWNALYDNSQAA